MYFKIKGFFWQMYVKLIYLYIMQIQFSGAGVLGIRALIVGCDFPLWMQYALVAYMTSFIILFGQFYTSAYNRKVIFVKIFFQLYI